LAGLLTIGSSKFSPSHQAVVLRFITFTVAGAVTDLAVFPFKT